MYHKIWIGYRDCGNDGHTIGLSPRKPGAWPLSASCFASFGLHIETFLSSLDSFLPSCVCLEMRYFILFLFFLLILYTIYDMVSR